MKSDSIIEVEKAQPVNLNAPRRLPGSTVAVMPTPCFLATVRKYEVNFSADNHPFLKCVLSQCIVQRALPGNVRSENLHGTYLSPIKAGRTYDKSYSSYIKQIPVANRTRSFETLKAFGLFKQLLFGYFVSPHLRSSP